MADTTVSPNNKSVAFRGRPQREPSVDDVEAKADAMLAKGMISDDQHKKLKGKVAAARARA